MSVCRLVFDRVRSIQAQNGRTLVSEARENVEIESKLVFQVKMTVSEGLRLGDLYWHKITASSVLFGQVRSENASEMSLEGSDECL